MRFANPRHSSLLRYFLFLLACAAAISLTLVGCLGNADGPGQVTAGNFSTHFIVRFKPEFSTLAKPDCAAAYLTMASAQKGYEARVVRQLFSGALVLSMASESPSGAALVLVGHLRNQVEVDYAELDMSLHPQSGEVAPARIPKGPNSPIADKVSGLRKLCGVQVTGPTLSR